MSKVYIYADLHLEHKKLLAFSPEREGDTMEEHDEILEIKYCATVKKADTCIFLGDVAFTQKGLNRIRGWPGNKWLVLGNHDKLNAYTYLSVFSKLKGSFKYQHYWLSHCPIHPDELRGDKNIHGHVHMNSIREDMTDPNYFAQPQYINVCIEKTDGYPILFDDIKEGRFV